MSQGFHNKCELWFKMNEIKKKQNKNSVISCGLKFPGSVKTEVSPVY